MKKSRNIKEILREDEVSLVELFRIFWDKKTFLIYTTIIGFVLGIIATVTTPREYTSRAKLLTEESNENQDSRALAGLAGLAGLNIDASSGADIPDYTTIVESQPFLLSLTKQKIYSQEEKKEVVLEDYLLSSKRKSLFQKIYSALRSVPAAFLSKERSSAADDRNDSLLKGSAITVLTGRELSSMAQLANRITITTEGRFVTLEVKMPEAALSAKMNQLVKEKLINYVINYKTVRRKRNLKFLENRTEEAKRNFQSAQMGLAGFQDRNLGLIVQTGRAKETQLQAQYNLYFGLYSSLSSQLEQARIKLKEETPVFSDFEPVSIPLSPSEPSIFKLILLYTVAGFFTGCFLSVIFMVKDFFGS